MNAMNVQHGAEQTKAAKIQMDRTSALVQKDIRQKGQNAKVINIIR